MYSTLIKFLTPENIIQAAEKAYVLYHKYQEASIKLSAGDIKNLQAICVAYTGHFLDANSDTEKSNKINEERFIPINFQWTDKKHPRIRPSRSTIYPQTYSRSYGNNAISRYAQTIVTLICAYQTARSENNDTYLWDARGQLCHFLKTLVVQLSHCDLKDEKTLMSVEKLISFIERLQLNDKIFKCGKYIKGLKDLVGMQNQKIRRLLAEIGRPLDKIKTIIVIQLKYISAESLTHKLSNDINLVFSNGIDIAMRMFAKKLPDAKATSITIVDSDIPILPFPHSGNNSPLNGHIIALASTYPTVELSCEKQVQNRIFSIAKDGMWQSNRGIKLTTDQATVDRFYEFEKRIANKQAVDPEDKKIFLDYMMFLGLLEQLALNAENVALSSKIAGVLGDFGTYGIIGGFTYEMCAGISAIVKSLKTKFSSLVTYAKKEQNWSHYEKKDPGWINNLTYILQINNDEIFIKLLDSIQSGCNQLIEQYIDWKQHPSKKLDTIQKMLAVFINNVRKRAKEIGSLGIEYQYDENTFPQAEFFLAVYRGKPYETIASFVNDLENIAPGIKSDLIEIEAKLALLSKEIKKFEDEIAEKEDKLASREQKLAENEKRMENLNRTNQPTTTPGITEKRRVSFVEIVNRPGGRYIALPINIQRYPINDFEKFINAKNFNKVSIHLEKRLNSIVSIERGKDSILDIIITALQQYTSDLLSSGKITQCTPFFGTTTVSLTARIRALTFMFDRIHEQTSGKITEGTLWDYFEQTEKYIYKNQGISLTSKFIENIARAKAKKYAIYDLKK